MGAIYNSKNYLEQISKLIDINKSEVLYNSSWYNFLNLKKFINIISPLTISKIMERKDFKKRIKKNISISMKEFIYPVLQGYDSVISRSDLEIGGNDQKFNLIFGR